MQDTTAYAMKAECHLPFEEAVSLVRDELATEGFGVLTEIDVKETLKQKLDVDFRDYTILGACNPPLAHEALTADIDIGLLLPCNVVVYSSVDPNVTEVAAIDPVAQLGITGRDDVAHLAGVVREKLERVIATVNKR